MDRNVSWQPAVESGIEIQWIEANGQMFEVATAGKGKRLALCLHGFPELHYSWRHQIPVLAEMGYRVWAPNLRGYGNSDRPDGIESYRLNNLLLDVASLIDASGAEEVTLLAHDWGGLIAWPFAFKNIRPLTRLVIMNCPHPMRLKQELRHWRQLKKSWYIFFFQLPWFPEQFFLRNNGQPIREIFRDSAVNKQLFDDTTLEPYRRAAMKPQAMTAMINYYRALVRKPDARNLGDGKVDIPTLLIWGEQDVAIDIKLVEGMEDLVPDLVIKRFPDASHWVQQDVPEKVNTTLQAWLELTDI